MDAIAEWSAAWSRVHDLCAPLSAEQAAVTVPACPDWSVRDLLGHMVGLVSDVLDGDEPDDHNPGWTQQQVDARHDATVAELLAEFDAKADAMRAWMADNGSRPMGDVTIHEQDLRGALGVSGAHDTDALHALRDRMAGAFAEALPAGASVALRGPGWTWSSVDGEADVVLEASDFDLTRALMSRRSAAQLRAWTTRGDVSPLLDAFTGLGDLPSADLSE